MQRKKEVVVAFDYSFLLECIPAVHIAIRDMERLDKNIDRKTRTSLAFGGELFWEKGLLAKT